MPISYRVYTKISKEKIVRTVKARCTGKYKGVEIMNSAMCADHVPTVGNVTEDAIKKYIQEQSEES